MPATISNKPMMTTRSLTIRYLIGLGLIASLSIAAFVVQLILIDTQQPSSAIMNASGRCHYFSQRVALFSRILVTATTSSERAKARLSIATATDRLEQNHNGLVNLNRSLRLPGRNSQEVKALYFSKSSELHPRIQKYMEVARMLVQSPDHELSQNNAYYQYIIANGLEGLIKDLEAVVNIYQRESELAVSRLRILETVIFVLTILLLALEVTFIFRPMVSKIEGIMKDLRVSADKLHVQYQMDLVHKIDRYLATTVTSELNVSEVIALVCKHLDFRCGIFWKVDQQKASLVPNSSWSSEEGAAAFEKASLGREFTKGIGLPGRVWQSGMSHWIIDVCTDSNFPRASEAQQVGLHAAFAFPVRFENQIFGVLEFFSSSIEAPDKTFLSHCDGIGVRIGQLIERGRLENELAHRQAHLIDSSKMAALGEMAGSMAHEINTPLGVIKLRANQLGRLISLPQMDVEAMKNITASIEASADYISSIIQGLRSFTRNASNDEMAGELLATVVNNTLSLCSERFSSRRIAIEIDDIPTVHIRCCPSQISQVMINILNNATDAVESLEEKWVAISFAEDETYVNIRITDSGSNLPKEVEKNLFHPFFTTKAMGKGTGLGLSISKEIIEAHKGLLFVDRDSVNTCFVIRLPKFLETTSAVA